MTVAVLGVIVPPGPATVVTVKAGIVVTLKMPSTPPIVKVAVLGVPDLLTTSSAPARSDCC